MANTCVLPLVIKGFVYGWNTTERKETMWFLFQKTEEQDHVAQGHQTEYTVLEIFVQTAIVSMPFRYQILS